MKDHINRITTVILLGMLLTTASQAQTPLGFPAEDFPEATKDGAWVTTNSPRALYYEGKFQKTYSGWVTKRGTIVIWSYNHQTKETATFTLHEDFQADTHDNPAFYVRKDGCIQVFYTKHNTEKLVRSFVSTHPEDISKWEPVDHIQTHAKSTYTLVFRLSAENDRVYLFTRALNYHPSALRSEDDGKTWSEPVQLINVGHGRPYQRMVSDGISKIHVAFTTGHPRNEKNNSVYYFYYENGAFSKLTEPSSRSGKIFLLSILKRTLFMMAVPTDEPGPGILPSERMGTPLWLTEFIHKRMTIDTIMRGGMVPSGQAKR